MKVLCSSLLAIAVIGTSGCAAFRRSIEEKDPATSDPLTAKYDQRDMLKWAQQIADLLLVPPFLPANDAEKPILVDLGIQNRTESHIDMKAITDTITTHMLDSGKIRLVNASRRDDLLKEQGYQLQNTPAEARMKIGRQLGARFMLTGSLVEIGHQSGRQVRLSKKQDIYYQLTAEITDLESGEIILRKQTDRLRQTSMPVIGW